MRAHIAAATACWIAVALAIAPSPLEAQCCGDCDGDGTVAIANLITAVRNALDGCPGAAPCCGDCNDDGSVTVNELVTAVGRALGSCDAPVTHTLVDTPTRTPTHTQTTTPSITETATVTPTATATVPPTATHTPIRAVDHGDGTITDLTTGLMWEKKIGGDGAPDGSNDHDADNRYPWIGRCQSTTTDCTNDGDCAVGVPCVAGDQQGTRLTIFKWVTRLNTTPFSGYQDWRVPSLDELRSVRDLDERPTVDPGFHAPGCGTSCLDLADADCSCTSEGPYWTATADESDASRAWRIDFDNGAVRLSNKVDDLRIRAVRGP
jgi:hypothetical protein